MDSPIRSAQDMLYIMLRQELDSMARNTERGTANPGTKDIYREAQGIKWQARRLARIAHAIEVLESIDPRPLR